jgi:hypothetical protein
MRNELRMLIHDSSPELNDLAAVQGRVALEYRLRKRAVPASSTKAFNAFAVVGNVSRAIGYMPLDLNHLGECRVSIHFMRLPELCSDAISTYR